jgi:hypothetical protein
VGSIISVTATSVADPTKSDTLKVNFIAARQSTVTGGDGQSYVSYGDNTFKPASGGNVFCGGPDRQPGTSDDTDNVVFMDGVSFLKAGDGDDPEYIAKGNDGIFCTTDDLERKI